MPGGTSLGVVVVTAAVAVGIFLTLRSADHGERPSKIDGKLDGIVKNVDRLLDRQAKNTLKIPGEPREEIESAVARVRERKLDVSIGDIHRVSTVLVQNSDQRNWGALMQLVGLRSFVNSTIAEAQQHIVHTVGPADHGQWFQGKPGEWILFEDQTLILDAKDQNETPHINDAPGHSARVYRYIIFKNCRLTYHGGELTFVNVFFDNCTFDIQHSHTGAMFAESVVAPTPFTTFSAD